jgi:hypothetical protein
MPHFFSAATVDQVHQPYSTRRGLSSMGTKIFNGLPTELKNVKNVNVFKKKLKSYLLNSVFYSLQELYLNNHSHGILVGKSVYLSVLCPFGALGLIKNC